MLKKCLVVMLTLLATALAIGACGGSSTGSDGTVSISTIDELPKASDAVAGASASISKTVPTPATTGIVLDTLSASNFEIGDSQAACQTSQQLRQLLTAATQGDRVLCYVQETFKNYADSGVDIYDGADHYFDLTGMTEGPDHVRLKIVKSGGVITSFTMYECSSGSQNGYIGQSISGTTFGMTTKGKWDGGDFVGKYYTGVTGVLNTNGTYLSKTITNAYTNGETFDSPTSWNEGTLVQGVSDFTVQGYGKYSTDGSSFYTDMAYATGELLGTTPITYAMGNGAAKFSSSDSVNSNSGTQGWLGDTAAISTDAQTYYLATDPTLPTASSTAPTTVAFSGDEVYDCSGTGIDVVVDEAAVATACDAKYGMQNYTWINCYTANNDPCSTSICSNFSGISEAFVTACEACFPGGSKDANTYTCLLTTVCAGAPAEAQARCTAGASQCQ